MNALAILGIALPIALAVGAGLNGWLTRRRETRGRIGTSEAAQLWAQTQTIMDVLMQRAEHAEAQVDKLFDNQASQFNPALAAISAAQKSLVEMVADLDDRLERTELIAREASQTAAKANLSSERHRRTN